MKKRISVRSAVTWVLPAILFAIYVRHLTHTGLLGEVLYESGDSAGDMLQVERSLERGWFSTGHHSDVGVHHPGPFALWLKAAANMLYTFGIGGSVYATTMSLFLGIRIAFLAVIGWAFARASSSHIVGWSSVLGITLLLNYRGTVYGLDWQGSTIHFMSVWAVLLMLSGALLLASGRGGAHLLIIGAGITAHVHTPIFPLGVLSLFIVALAMLRSFSSSRLKISMWGLWLIFVVPLVARVFLEPGWPLSYARAVSRRKQLAETLSGSSPLDSLSRVINLPAPLLIVLLALPALGALYVWRRGREAAFVLAASSLWAAIVLIVSPSQDRVATELVWITGLLLFSAAALLAALASVFVKIFHKIRGLRRYWFVTVLNILVSAALLAAISVSITGVLPTSISDSGGGDGQHVPIFADTIAATGEPFVLVLTDPFWFTTSSGVLLELNRRGLEFCIVTLTTIRRDLDTFQAPEKFCQPNTKRMPAFMITWDASEGLKEMPEKSRLDFDIESFTDKPQDPDRWICSQRPFGGVCLTRLPEDAREILVSSASIDRAYGNVLDLRLLSFACTPTLSTGCVELGNAGS